MKSKTKLPLLGFLIVCLLSAAWATFSGQSAASAQAQSEVSQSQSDQSSAPDQPAAGSTVEHEAFEVKQYKWYKHPQRDWEIMLDKWRLGAHGRGDSIYFDIRTFKLDQWGLLQDENGRRIPLTVYWDGERLLAKWLP